MKIKDIIKQMKRVIYPCYCSICEGYYQDWLTTGDNFEILKKVQIVGGGRRKALCPNCSSNDRLRMIHTYLKYNLKLLDITSNPQSILHVAPERQLKEIFLILNQHNYIAADKFNFGEDTIQMDITEIKFADSYFDLIICNHVLEHIVDDSIAMKELFRVLKIGGKAILQIPYSKTINFTLEDFRITHPEERKKAFGQSDHVRIYALNDYVQRLSNAGFSVQKINPFNVKWHIQPQKLGLNKNEDLIIVTKL